MSLAPFVRTPVKVVEKMLEAADLKDGEILYDLGSGDGRIIMMAAKKYGVNAVGVELDEGRVKESRKKIRETGLEDKVKVLHTNFMDVDLSPANVITLYLLESANKTLRPNLERYLKRGARVVSHDFQIPSWRPIQVIDVDADYGINSTIYVYKIV